MITSGNSFKLPYTIFLEDRRYMTILTRHERERLVLELYNQGKTIREIAREVRMSFRDIGVILNKAVEEKSQGTKQQDDDVENREQEQQHLSLAAQAYKLFSDRKTPLEVAIALNLGESEATKFYKEYWKLKQLHNLNMVYEELKDDIEPFLKLYKLAKAKGIGVQQVVNALAITNNDLPAIEERFERIRNDVSMLQFQKHTCKRNLFKLNNQLATTTKLLNSLRMSCKRERREIKNLQNEKARLEAFITEFKSNNEEYLEIKEAAEEKVKDVLTNSKLLLQFAIASVIESLRRNPELCNFVLKDISNNNHTAYRSNYLSLMSEQQQQESFSYINDNPYVDLILEEAEKLYNDLTTKLTNDVMAATAAMKIIPSLALPLSPSNNNSQKLNYENDNTYQTEELGILDKLGDFVN
jgi:hypothetical protein